MNYPAAPALRGTPSPTLWRRRMLALLLMIGTLLLIVPVWQAGMASANFFRVQFLLNEWDKNSDNLTAERYQQAEQLLAVTLAKQPDHPHYLLTMAKVLEWGWYKGLRPASEMAVVETYYQKAIQLRCFRPCKILCLRT